MTPQASLFQMPPKVLPRIDRTPTTIAQNAEAPPFLKWAGGKGSSWKLISKLLPETIVGAYFEPFFGGGSTFWRLAIANRLRGPVILNDANPILFAALCGLRADVDGVIARLQKHETAYDLDPSAYYDAQRKRVASMDLFDVVESAALVIFINKTCFNGVWRVNSKGKFNTAWCKNTPRRPTILNETRLRACAEVLASVQVLCADFADVTAHAEAGDTVFLDSPYVPVSATADFTSYTSDGFGDDDQVRLRDEVLRLRSIGATALACNADAPRVHALYAGLPVTRTQVARAVNNDSKKRGKVGELLIGGV
jgi:DNA adenine methylase